MPSLIRNKFAQRLDGVIIDMALSISARGYTNDVDSAHNDAEKIR